MAQGESETRGTHEQRRLRSVTGVLVVFLLTAAATAGASTPASAGSGYSAGSVYRAEAHALRIEGAVMRATLATVGIAYGAVSIEGRVRDRINGRSERPILEQTVLDMLEALSSKALEVWEDLSESRLLDGKPILPQLDELRRMAEANSTRLQGLGEHHLESAEQAIEEANRALRAYSRVEEALQLSQATAVWLELALHQLEMSCSDAFRALYPSTWSRWRSYWRSTPPTDLGVLVGSSVRVLEALADWGPTAEDRLTPDEVVDWLVSAQPYVMERDDFLNPLHPKDLVPDHEEIVHEKCRIAR